MIKKEIKNKPGRRPKLTRKWGIMAKDRGQEE
jgi:hypothetical protein